MTVGYGGTGGSQDELLQSLRRQGRLSAVAAMFAGVAALAPSAASLLNFFDQPVT